MTILYTRWRLVIFLPCKKEIKMLFSCLFTFQLRSSAVYVPLLNFSCLFTFPLGISAVCLHFNYDRQLFVYVAIFEFHLFIYISITNVSCLFTYLCIFFRCLFTFQPLLILNTPSSDNFRFYFNES